MLYCSDMEKRYTFFCLDCGTHFQSAPTGGSTCPCGSREFIDDTLNVAYVEEHAKRAGSSPSEEVECS